jgi:threonine aldolase
VDGARLWNAAVALAVPPAELVRGADTLMVALSKGLCCPVGSLLLGSAALMAEARRLRQLFGGGMRQVGVLAAAGLVALESLIPRLADDHANARILSDALGRCAGARVTPAATNIVVAQLEGRGAPEVASALKARGVLASAMDRTTLRLVTHHDVSRAECEQAAAVLAEVLA